MLAYNKATVASVPMLDMASDASARDSTALSRVALVFDWQVLNDLIVVNGPHACIVGVRTPIVYSCHAKLGSLVRRLVVQIWVRLLLIVSLNLLG